MNVLAPPEWTGLGLCAGQYDDRWFPNIGRRDLKAKQICQRCPVKLLCREYGMDERHGVWGGLNASDRRALGRGRGRRGIDYDIPECDR